MGLIKSTWDYTCPRCRQTMMFKQPFEFSKPLAMKEKCENCNLNFTPEPGFYFGAMFVSYILTAFAFLGIALTLVFYFKWSVNGAMGIVILFGLLGYFWVMRFSRSIYIHMMIKYDKAKYKK